MLPGVAQAAAHVWWHVDHDRSAAQVIKDDVIRCRGVRREYPQAIVITEDSGNVTVARAERCLPALPLRKRHRGYGPKVSLTSALEVPLVIERLDGLLSRVTVGKVVRELQLADAAIDSLVFGNNRRWKECGSQQVEAKLSFHIYWVIYAAEAGEPEKERGHLGRRGRLPVGDSRAGEGLATAGWKPALLFPTEKLITRCNSFMHCLDVRQLPSLIEKFLLWTVEAEQHFKLAAGLGRNPVRILPWRRL